MPPTRPVLTGRCRHISARLSIAGSGPMRFEQLLEKQAAEDPRSATALSLRAESELPERPKLATDLLERGLAATQQDLGSLRLAEVKSIIQAYREKLHNPQAANDFCRKWLKFQRDRLSETDAEGPVTLAAQYEELLQDRATARELLVRAWKIDPGSKEVAEALRIRGYRRVKDEWVEATPGAAAGGRGESGRELTSQGPARRRPRWACGAGRSRTPAGNSGASPSGNRSPARRASSSSSGCSSSRTGSTSSTSSTPRAKSSPGSSPITSCRVRSSRATSSRRDDRRVANSWRISYFFVDFCENRRRMWWLSRPIAFLTRSPEQPPASSVLESR